MIGLPNRVRPARLTPMNQIEGVTVALGALMRQHQEVAWQAPDHVHKVTHDPFDFKRVYRRSISR
jgi:hypothetical protein